MKLMELKDSNNNMLIEVEGNVAMVSMNRPIALYALNA